MYLDFDTEPASDAALHLRLLHPIDLESDAVHMLWVVHS